jgi:hypothetical protein
MSTPVPRERYADLPNDGYLQPMLPRVAETVVDPEAVVWL